MFIESKRWIMLIANIIINVCIGAGYAWSVFQPPLIEKFGWTPVEASLAFTLIMGVSAIPMPFVGKLRDYVQPRMLLFFGGLLYVGCMFLTGYVQSLIWLYLSFGVGCGLGQGIIYSAGTTNMVQLFPDKRGLCSGLLAAGMGSGAIIIAPTAAALIGRYGVLATFKILGIVFGILIWGLSTLIITAPENFRPKGWTPRVNFNNMNVTEKNWVAMLQDPLFYIIAGIFATGTISGMMVIGHASPLFQATIKVSPQTAAMLVGLLSLFNTSGRIFWGSLSDKIGRLKTVLILFLVVGLSMLGLAVNFGDSIFIILMMCIGLCYGGFMSLIASLTADSFGVKHLPINFGIMFLAYGIASFIGPRLAAVVQQANNGDYSKAFLVTASVSIIGIVLTIMAMRMVSAGKAEPERRK